MIEYNKLVRDKIPEIIKKDNKIAVTRILSEKEYIEELNKKLQEEVTEYLKDRNIEELADILEVIYAIVEINSSSKEQLESIRLSKANSRGSFKEKIFLEKVND